MQEIKINLAIEEANLILEALGQLPFARVYALIGKIQEQATQQLQPTDALQAAAAPLPSQAGARR
jgi:hypothetical protein